GLLGLLLDTVAHELSGSRVNGTSAAHEDEISRSPSLGVGPLWRRATLALDYVFGHSMGLLKFCSAGPYYGMCCYNGLQSKPAGTGRAAGCRPDAPGGEALEGVLGRAS